MRTDRIDFISAYCDSWCERCGYTSRCTNARSFIRPGFDEPDR